MFPRTGVFVVVKELQMKAWQRFEDDCCKYLNNNYGSARVRFIVNGGSDSTSSDIKVYINGINIFNIEVKSPDAQSGQFVVLNENGKLVFSPRNKSDIEEAKPFLEYMNAHYDRYATATRAGVNLDMDSAACNEWIINHYLQKNSRYMITHDGFSFVIFPIEKYGKYFTTTCRYRIKKSGSVDVPSGTASSIAALFNGLPRYEGKKLLVTSSKYYAKGDRLSLGEYDYLVSEKFADGSLYIRRLSNTHNANVIFVISLNRGQDIKDITAFKNSL